VRGRPATNAGFTYLWVLLTVAIMAAGLAAVAEVASTALRRDKEAELLFAGDQFARAIALYRSSSPGVQQYPQRLEDLLADNRFPNVRRYLRRVYVDPMTGSADWTLVRGPGGGIVGVHSRATGKPLKTANFPAGYEAFGSAASYAEWRFVAGVDGRLTAAAKAGTAAAPPGGAAASGGGAAATQPLPTLKLEPAAPLPAVRPPSKP
jgi:type II secretory pathway pseudopilin PulG